MLAGKRCLGMVAFALCASACQKRTHNESSVLIQGGTTFEGRDAELQASSFAVPLWHYTCTSRPDVPDGCSGSLLEGGRDVITAFHCVKERMSRFPVTTIVGTDVTSAKHVPPPWEAVCQSQQPLPGFVRVTDVLGSGSIFEGSDMALVRLPAPLASHATIPLGNVAAVAAGNLIRANGFGFENCISARNNRELAGDGILRTATFLVHTVDGGMGAIYLTPDASGAQSCYVDSGMGYTTVQDGRVVLVGVHRGKPGVELERERGITVPRFYGSLLNSRAACELFGKAQLPNPNCRPR